MTLWTKKGTITKDTTTGVHDQAFSGITSEAPKALFIWGNACTALDTYTDGYQQTFGYSDGTDDCCVAQCNEDNTLVQNSWTEIRNDAIIAILDPTQLVTGADLARATVKTLDSTGFTLTWSVANATQYILHYFAIGGSDITNVKCSNQTVGQTTTGNRDYTGFGFQPDFVVVLGTNVNITAYNTITAGGTNSIAFANNASAGDQCCVETKIRDGVATNDTNLRLGNATVQTGSRISATDTVQSQADFVSFISDGIRLNLVTAYANVNVPLSFLGIKGGFWDVGPVNVPTATGTQDISITAARKAYGIMTIGGGVSTFNSIANAIRLSIGASDGTNEGCAFVGDLSASDPIATMQHTTTDKVVDFYVPNATATSSTVEKKADLSDLNSTAGQFTFNWTTADATSRRAFYFTVSTTNISAANIHKYDLRQYATQSNIEKYHAREYVQAGIANLVVHIPLYIYPFHWIEGNEWQQLADLIATYPTVKFIIKVNPDSGPGASQNSDFVAGFNILTGQGNAAHIKILGYVFTSYGARPIQDVKDDIDAYVSFYGGYIDGIMLDEMDNITGDEAYYSEITDYIHDVAGLQISWGNPGTSIAESYVSQDTVDVFEIAETADYPTSQTITDNTFAGAYASKRFAVTVHGATSYNQSLVRDFATKADHIFVTSDVSPNPYDTLSEYLDELATESMAMRGSIHRYNLAGSAILQNIHKYHMLAYTLASSIQKYGVLAYVTEASIHKYHIVQNILQSSILKYHLRGAAIADSIHKYNLLGTALATNIHKYGLSAYAIATSIHKYDMLSQVAALSIHKYNVLQNILQSSVHGYHLRGSTILTNIMKYNMLQYVLQSSSIHKYHIESIAAVVAETIMKYHIMAYTTASNIHKYTILNTALLTSIHKYHLLTSVLTDNIHKYNILTNVLQSSIHKYDVRAFVTHTNSHVYNVLQYILQNSIHKYNIEGLATVLADTIMKYNIGQYVVVANINKYNLFQFVTQTNNHIYSILNTVMATNILKYNIAAVVTALNAHKYHIFQIVQSNSIQKYHILITVLQSSIHRYKINGMAFVTNVHNYSIKAFTTVSSIHKYNIGQLGKKLVSMLNPSLAVEALADASKRVQDVIKQAWS